MIKKVGFIAIIVLFLGVMIIGTINKVKTGGGKSNQQAEATEIETTEPEVVVEAPTEDYEDVEQDDTQYEIGMGLEAERNKDGRVTVKEPEPEPEPKKKKVQKDPTYATNVIVFDHTVVPERNVDGSSCKAYLNSVTLNSFGTYWGTDLTAKDFKGGKLTLVGVEQNPDDKVKGYDLQSTGWLIHHLGEMKASDAIKFTNLHVIGHMSASHVAMLCSYDWYSAFGLQDTLVVFEDISGTLKISDFNDGDIFSAMTYAHNVRIMNVNGFNVVVIQYNTFK